MDATSIVAKYLQKQANENQHSKKQFEELAAAIKENEELQKTVQVYNDEYSRLSMELFAMKAFQERCTQQRQQQLEAEAAALTAYKNLTQLREQLACIDLQSLASYKLHSQYLELQEDLKAMQRHFQLKRQIHEQMEQRKIVQELRQKQREFPAAQQELKAMKMHSAAANQESMRKLSVAKEQRNKKTVDLIKGAKELAKIREEINDLNELEDESQTLESLEQKKHELLQKLQQLQQNFNVQEQQNLVVVMQPASTAAPSAVVFDPINFLQALQSQEQNMPSLQNFLENLWGVSQRENEQEEIEQPTTFLRSILRTPPSEGRNVTNLSHKKVHFDLPESDTSSRSSRAPIPEYSNMKTNEPVKENEEEVIEIETGIEIVDLSEDNDDEVPVEEAISKSALPTSPEPSNLQTNESEEEEFESIDLTEDEGLVPVEKVPPMSANEVNVSYEDVPKQLNAAAASLYEAEIDGVGNSIDASATAALQEEESLELSPQLTTVTATSDKHRTEMSMSQDKSRPTYYDTFDSDTMTDNENAKRSTAVPPKKPLKKKTDFESLLQESMKWNSNNVAEEIEIVTEDIFDFNNEDFVFDLSDIEQTNGENTDNFL